ncbi:cardiolipin synthase [Alkalitalea saponilacus]|uniref:Cardiolipin synthase n=1 Tax=Alkalitalea saponilacus TaxID=889453 RepID=A0A1T5AGP4_9BACT|nr:cardiolipin synthase [Alkalitalea saponilacus]ASB48707.1 cardiolipin synthase [Alkalitalea saponilacus]SKB34134.1 cardiolipin synthase [Alkalitalea saponilacus]
METFQDIINIINPLVLVVYVITILIVVVFTVLENRSPLKTISWVLVLIFLPVIGFIFFIFFGQNFRKEKIIARKGLRNHDLLSNLAHAQIHRLSEGEMFDNQAVEQNRNLITLLLNNSNAVVTVGNSIKILQNGRVTFSEIIESLQKAKQFIHLEYYIFADDKIGGKIKSILKRKASEGVEVRLIVDDVGSWELKKPFFDEMWQAGVQAYSFLQVRFPNLTSKVNYRNHRKIIVIDGEVGFIGGLNIADRYLDGNGEVGLWRDTHLKIEGDAVKTLQTVFLTDWYFVSQTELNDRKYFPTKEPLGQKMVQVVASGPDSDWPGIMMGIFHAIASARKYVYIATPYFMPSESVLLALKTAALGGVDVRIIIPERSDAFVTLLSSRSFIKEMQEAEVKFYFYREGFLHSKVMVVDDTIAIIGSANMDFRSFEQNFEITAFIFDEESAVEMRETFMDDIRASRLVDPEEWSNRPLIEKTKESFARLMSPLL